MQTANLAVLFQPLAELLRRWAPSCLSGRQDWVPAGGWREAGAQAPFSEVSVLSPSPEMGEAGESGPREGEQGAQKARLRRRGDA